MRFTSILAALAALLLTAPCGAQETYPQRPIRIIVSYGAGGAIGVVARLLPDHITQTVPTSLPKDFASFIAYLKANPEKVNFGTAGPGSSADLAAALLAKMTGIEFVRVPYRTTPSAMNDLITGQIGFMLDSQNVLAPQIQTGALRGLAVSSVTRSRLLPDLPTLDELGLKGFEASSWQAMLAPAKTPQPIIDKLADAVARALADPGVQKRYFELGYELPRQTGPEALAPFLARERAKWGPLAKESGAG